MARKKTRTRRKAKRGSPFGASLADRLRGGGMMVIFVRPVPHDASPAEKRAYAKRVSSAVRKQATRK